MRSSDIICQPPAARQPLQLQDGVCGAHRALEGPQRERGRGGPGRRALQRARPPHRRLPAQADQRGRRQVPAAAQQLRGLLQAFGCPGACLVLLAVLLQAPSVALHRDAVRERHRCRNALMQHGSVASTEKCLHIGRLERRQLPSHVCEAEDEADAVCRGGCTRRSCGPSWSPHCGTGVGPSTRCRPSRCCASCATTRPCCGTARPPWTLPAPSPKS